LFILKDDFLNTDITFLKGVGPERGKLLQSELKIYTYRDLLFHFPFRYIDRSNFTPIRTVFSAENTVQIKAKVLEVKELGEARKKRLTALVGDDSGTIELVWFKGITWIKPSLIIGQELTIFGRVSKFGNRYNITHPDIEKYEYSLQKQGSLQPVYHSGEKLTVKGLHSKGIEKLQRVLVSQIQGKIVRTLSEELVQLYKLMDLESALQQIHFPDSNEQLKLAQIRLKFEELFFMQLNLIQQKLITQRKSKGYLFEKVGVHFNTFYNHHLPFELTNAQKRVVKEIRKDMATGMQMNRLLQGDVGSGKTLVAVLASLIALDNDFQACILAPTEILATQHFNDVSELLAPMGIKLELLTGSTKTARRKTIAQGLQNGEISILIGTHALLEDKVQFKNLGLAIIDEQHKFGVAQRAKLRAKNNQPPHVLVMTATPIPRTLAMTLYGDLDISVIDELPGGRKPIQTHHFTDGKRLVMFQFLEDEIKKGRQVYIVFPLIEESETMDYKDLKDGYESVCRRFPRPDYQISIVHGKMKPEDKEYEMQLFAQGKTQILVATTVIEVGVNVPNASVMVIESSERFGLSTLHQLRGRVGRGAEQSYCILMSGYKLSEDARTRLETMVRTTDGFDIAEVDLRLRGPGDVMGTQQSGILDLKLADLAKDQQLLHLSRMAASDVLEEDPDLTHKKNYEMRIELFRQIKHKSHWSRVG
jgi:ATP-dependent DNA helicase RecG